MRCCWCAGYDYGLRWRGGDMVVHWSLERLVFWGPNFLYTPKEARGSTEQERVLSLSAMSALSFAKQCMSKAAVQQLSSKLLKTEMQKVFLTSIQLSSLLT